MTQPSHSHSFTAPAQTARDAQLGFDSSSHSEAAFRCVSVRFLILLLNRNPSPGLLRAHVPFSGKESWLLAWQGWSACWSLVKQQPSLGSPRPSFCFSASLGFCGRLLPGGLAAHAVPSGALGTMTSGQRKQAPSGDAAVCPKLGGSEGAGTEARPEPGSLGS